MAGTYEVPLTGSSNESQEPKIKTFIESWNAKLGTGNKLEGSEIVAESIKNTQIAPGMTGRLYKPSIIATEESRENVAFGTLTTPDEVKEVVLPTNGLIIIAYQALVKQSVTSTGKAAIFIGANQLKGGTSGEPKVNETASVSGTEFFNVATTGKGLVAGAGGATAHVTTGQLVAPEQVSEPGGGFAVVFAAAGTYAISVQFKASSGKITAKERKLWVGVMGA